MPLELNGNEYKVSSGGLTIELLPKEFALLQFLYRNRGEPSAASSYWIKYGPWSIRWSGPSMIIFTGCARSCADWGGLISGTIRGFDYSLAVPGSPEGVAMNPATNDPELRDTMREVFMKFHDYGQGKSMLTLALQQVILGYELDPHYSMIVHFVQGDLEWMIDTDEISLKDRIFYLNCSTSSLAMPR